MFSNKEKTEFHSTVLSQSLKQISSKWDKHINISENKLFAVSNNDWTRVTTAETALQKITKNISGEIRKHEWNNNSQLRVYLNNCKQIANQGIESFGFEISHSLTGLKELNLNFDECEQITDKGMNTFLSQIARQLLLLETLKANFSQCLITDQGFKTLGSQSFKYFTKLQNLDLDFSVY